MPRQNKNIPCNEIEKQIMDLEKKYYNIILKIVQSKEFVDDLFLIEKEISDNYSKFENIWDLKNKIKIPAERVVRHHLYLQLNDLITGIYPSPLSSDFGIRTNDAVICVDIKTIDTVINSGDLRGTAVEKNQVSFQNSKYPYIPIISNMNPMDDFSRKPILTYVVKIVYSDNGNIFKLCREKYPSMVFTCIPNGKLSRFFENNIVQNCKTYDYYKETIDPIYKPIPLTREQYNDNFFVDNLCERKGYVKINKSGNKSIYLDPKTQIIWVKTTNNKKCMVRPVKSGGSVRYDNDCLKYRFDSDGNSWTGYDEWTLPRNDVLEDQTK